MLKQMLSVVLLTVAVGVASVLAGPTQAIQEHGKAMLHDAEEMVMHGGMGDGGAILHHCAEVTKHATAHSRRLAQRRSARPSGGAVTPRSHHLL